MKKLLLSLTAFTVITLSAGAQVQRTETDKVKHERKSDGPGARHGKKGHPDKMMMHKLNFSDQQKQQIKELNQEFKIKNEELKKNDGITVKAYKEKKQSLMTERKSKMDAILTAEQKVEMQKLRTEGKQRHEMSKMRADKDDAVRDGKERDEMKRDGKPGMDRAGDLEKMKTDLGLSNEQAAKIQANRESFKTKAMAIRSNDALTQDQKKEQFKSLNEDMKKEMKSILTAEQLKKFEENRGKGQK